jgi:hypothetical protein
MWICSCKINTWWGKKDGTVEDILHSYTILGYHKDLPTLFNQLITKQLRTSRIATDIWLRIWNAKSEEERAADLQRITTNAEQVLKFELKDTMYRACMQFEKVE